MKLLISILLAFMIHGFAFSQARNTTQTTPNSLESELKTITREMHDLLGRGEKDQLLSYFADDFIGTSYDGETVTKNDLRKSFSTPPREAKVTRDIEDFTARGNSESAIVTYRIIEHVEIGEDKHANQFRYTDSFVKRNGRWLLLASQATRIEEEPKLVKVDPSLYDLYAGHYEAAPTLIFTVVRDGDKLLGEAPNGSVVELLPASETSFFIKGRAGRTTFIKNEQGQVTHMMIGATKMKKID
jgi:hypothetical protein